jgi:hypothetical protein
MEREERKNEKRLKIRYIDEERRIVIRKLWKKKECI